MTVSPELQKAMDRAKYKLISKDQSAFLSTILFSLRMYFDKTIPTACTNGINLTINPDFFMDLRDSHRVSLLAHEAWHVAFKHVIYGNGLNLERHNEAGDHVINLMLKKAGYDIPSNWLCDPRFEGMSTLEVYKILMAENPPSPPDMMKDIQQKPNSQAAAQQQQQQVNSTILKAAHTANQRGAGAGSIPGEIEAEISRITSPKLSWDAIFRRVVNNLMRNDYSLKKFDHRFFPEFFLPTLQGEGIGEVAFAVDASGSVTDVQLNSMFTQIEYVHKTLKPSKITLMIFDHGVRAVHTITDPKVDIFKLGVQARGGTAFEPVFEYYNKVQPEILVIFSDLDARPIPAAERPRYPVVWVAVNAGKREVNFGKRIAYDM